MNDPQAQDRANHAAAEELFGALLEESDEASAWGLRPRGLDPLRLPAPLRGELTSLSECVLLLNAAARQTTLPSLAAYPTPPRRLDGISDTIDSVSDDSLSGERIGRFEIIRELGRGGHGVVFLARDPAVEREVALKLPRAEALITPQLRARFVRESRAAGRLDHPHVLTVFEVGEDGAVCYLISPFCRGPSLARWLAAQRGPVDPRDAARLLAGLAEGVEHAHRHGVLHRDIKPANILLDPVNGDEQAHVCDGAHRSLASYVPKLTDFGLAKLLETTEQETATGSILGTPAYMAPEQASGRPDQIGAAADVYGLGAVLYELLTLRPPLVGSTDAETLRLVATVEPLAPRRIRPTIPHDLDAICRKCLEKSPAERYRSAAELAQDLDCFLAGQPTQARPLLPVKRVVRWVRRHRSISALVVLGCLSICVLIAGLWWHSSTLAAALAVSEEHRLTATQMQAQANRNEQRARAQENLASRHLYAQQMRQAFDAADQGSAIDTQRILAQFDERSPWATLRGFEWHYLQGALHREQLVINAHQEVYAAAYAPDGRYLVTGGDDGTIKLWSPRDGQQLGALEGHSECVNSLAFSADGRLLASGSCDQSVKVWDTATSREIFSAPLTGKVNVVRFSPDDRWLAAVVDCQSMSVWNARTFECVKKFVASGTVESLAWSNDSQVLATNSSKVGANILEAGSWQRLRAIGMPANQGRYLPNSPYFLRDSSEAIELEDATTRDYRGTLCRVNALSALAVSADGRQFAAGGKDQHFVKVWRIVDRGGAAPLAVLDHIFCGHTNAVKDLAFSPNGDQLASASRDGTLRLWNLAAHESRLPVVRSTAMGYAHGVPPTCSFSADLRRAAVRSQTHVISVWNLEDLSSPSMQKILAPQAVEEFGLSADGAALIWRDQTSCRIWDLRERKLRSEFNIEAKHRISRAAISPDGQLIATFTDHGGIAVYETDTGRLRLTSSWAAETVDRQEALPRIWLRITPDNRRLMIVPSGFDTTLLELGSGNETEVATVSASDAASPDGRFVAKTDGFNVVIDDTHDDSSGWTVPGPVSSVCFSPDGKTLAAACESGVCLWHVLTGLELARFEIPAKKGARVQFSSDGRRLGAFVETEEELGELYMWSVAGH